MREFPEHRAAGAERRVRDCERRTRKRRRSASTTAACCGFPPTAARRPCSATASASRISASIRAPASSLASDQQGHYIPSTPLHVVRDRQFYGFLSDKLPREVYPAPIAEPLTWIPHAANASAMSQVWLYGARMGPLNDALVHIGFNKPGDLPRAARRADAAGCRRRSSASPATFDFPPLNGSVNPADGQLYLTGFQILGWGTTATRLAGLGRVRYTGAAFTGPREVVPMDKGVLLRFDVALDAHHGGRPGQLLRDQLALQADLQLRLAAVPGRRHARHRSPRASRAYLSKRSAGRLRRRAAA